MSFQTFLAKTKHMFNIFEDVGEPKTESAKIRFLLDGIRSTEQQPIVQAIRAGMTLEPNAYTLAIAANMIASQVTPKENQRNAWRALSAEQQANIREAREKDPEIKKRPQKRKSVSDEKDLKIKKLQKKISSLKRNANKWAEDDDGSDDDDTDWSCCRQCIRWPR